MAIFFYAVFLSFLINSSDLFYPFHSVPLEIIAKIIAQPDREKLEEIINIQITIHRFKLSQDSFNDKPVQKSPKEIRNALFPCLNFLIASKKIYNNPDLKKQVQYCSNTILKNILPQGIAFFLLPSTVQLRLYKESIEPLQKELSYILSNFTDNDRFTVDEVKGNITIINYNKTETLINIRAIDYNNVYYYFKGSSKIKPYIPIEIFLHWISRHFAYLNRLGNGYILHEVGFFRVFSGLLQCFNQICLLDSTDLSLPSLKINGTLGHFIIERFCRKDGRADSYYYPKSLLSDAVQKKIDFVVSSLSFLDQRPFEYQCIIEAFVNIYLSGTEEEHNELIRHKCKNQIPPETGILSKIKRFIYNDLLFLQITLSMPFMFCMIYLFVQCLKKYR